MEKLECVRGHKWEGTSGDSCPQCGAAAYAADFSGRAARIMDARAIVRSFDGGQESTIRVAIYIHAQAIHARPDSELGREFREYYRQMLDEAFADIDGNKPMFQIEAEMLLAQGKFYESVVSAGNQK